MKKIVLFGAGKSATVLIDYLLSEAPLQKWQLTVVDKDLLLIRSKIGKSYYAKAVTGDLQETETRQKLVKEADLVISLLPPALHLLVVKDCIHFKKHLLTASYISPQIRKLEAEINRAGILVMGEMGLDPGLDHMSAMQLIHSIEKKGGIIHSFKSYCGGLITPENDNNPWHYKLSWNPRNVVTAGSEGASFRENGEEKHIAASDLFADPRSTYIPGMGKFEYYPNRDSLAYMNLYNLQDVPTFMRATLRYPGFCEGWNALVKLGLTDEKKIHVTDRLQYVQWATRQVSKRSAKSPEEAVAAFLDVRERSRVMRQLKYLGLFEKTAIRGGNQSDADILQALLEEKLSMAPEDRDMIIMQHEVEFDRRNIDASFISYMIVAGEDSVHSAMAKTVGLPLGILAKLIMSEKVNIRGLHIPVMQEVYKPVLKELEHHDIHFEEVFE